LANRWGSLSLAPARQIEVSYEHITRVVIARVAVALRPPFLVAIA
jgi:hypothetical protein